MQKLFIATIQIRRSQYMGKDDVSTSHRLVWAASESEAEDKVRAAVEKSDPYSTSVSLDYVECFEAIQ